MTLTATETGSLWFAADISNFNDMSHEDLSTTARMTEGNYGWIDLSTGQKISGTGDSKSVTYTSKWGQSVSTNAYFVGNFNKGDTIGFWITNANGVLGSSQGSVQMGENAGLQSRQLGRDQAGNTIINFGFNPGGSVEFITAGGETVAGQPLPGVLATLLAGAGAWGGMKRFRRRKNA